MFFVAALILGLISNLHCLGMCGPLAMALPVGQLRGANKAFSILLYNIGRIAIYAVLGFIVASFGKGLNLIGIQQQVSILAGVSLVFLALIPYLKRFLLKINSTILLQTGHFRSLFSSQIKKRNRSSMFVLGVLNGMLPCGLVYVALAGVLASSTALEGMLYMVLFGVGTLPVMFMVPMFSSLLAKNVRQRFQKLVPITVLAFGLLLILRGSNLGIPFVSPAFNPTVKGVQIIKCH